MTAEPLLGVSRSATGKSWRPRLADERSALALAQRAGLSDVLSRVLAARGITAETVESFLNPSLRASLPDPSGLAGMDEAVATTLRAIDAGERIAVFGDYDVDGATSAALLKRYFGALGIGIGCYIPDRLKEGYGPNGPALRSLKEAGTGLVITVDCGTTASAALREGREAGLKLIVLDHHLATGPLPEVDALVNPRRPDCLSGLGDLAAVGVTFLFAIALNRALRTKGQFAERDEPDLMGLLDLVALGTVADVVPLTGLNRVFVSQGLKIMRRRANHGLAALGDAAGLDRPPEPYHLGFVLGPRVNAGGRIGAPDLGFRLLSTDDRAEATSIASELDRLNRERQALEAAVLEEAVQQIEGRLAASGANRPPPLIVAKGEGWHAGVIGIVASRLKDRYGRPSLVVTVDGSGEGKGSGRSIAGVDLGAAVADAAAEGHLVNGGGHPMAAGLTVRAEKADALAAFLTERLSAAVERAGEASALKIDAVISPAGATTELLAEIERAAPFGAGHPEPRVVLPQVMVSFADIVGKDHVRCALEGDGVRLKGIAFRAAGTVLGDALLNWGEGPLHVAGRLKLNRWQGRESVELTIEDAAPARRTQTHSQSPAQSPAEAPAQPLAKSAAGLL